MTRALRTRRNVALAFLLLTVAGARAAPLGSVLTDNATGDESAIATGASYTAEPPFSNPADPSGKRLIDRGGQWNDWNNTVGINGQDQVVTFDLHGTYRLGRAALLFDTPAKPAHVDVALAEQPEGPWREMGRITPEERLGWYELTPPQALPGRYVRLAFKLREWGWYLREVKLWGTRGNEPGPEVVLPTVRTGDRLLLTDQGQPRASIVVAAEPTAKALRAARDLQEHILRMSGAALPLRTDDQDWTGTLLLVGRSRYLDQADVQVPVGYPGNERVLLRTVGDRIALVGNDDGDFAGTEFAVQVLLERLGCGWFGPEELWQVVPNTPTVAVPPLAIDHTPAFALRSLWIGQGKRWYLGGPPLRSNHAHDAILPPKEYFMDHPEYYALVGGTRRAEGEWQLCTANPEVIRLTIAQARAAFDKAPTEVMFSLSNNDCGGFCECADCGRTGSNPGTRMLAFANAVARGLRETHPDKGVIFLAYWYTAMAPTEALRAEPGVCVMVVASACHAHPESDPGCPGNVAWEANFRRWAATGARLGIYEWYIPGCSQKPWRRLPWIAGETAARDQDLWRSLGVTWVTYESQTAYEEQPYPLRWPLFYVAAKRLWDASLSADTILTDACEKLYGTAAAPMRGYYRELEDALRRAQVHGGTWNLPAADVVYTPTLCERLRQQLAAAAAAAPAANPRVRERIAAETAAWQLAEQTLAELRAASGRQPLHIIVNGNQYGVDKETITGKLVRELGGIAVEEAVFLIGDEGERLVKDEDELKVQPGMRFRSAPK